MKNTFFIGFLAIMQIFWSCDTPSTHNQVSHHSNSSSVKALSKKWHAILKISPTESIPFVFEINNNNTVSLINGKEKIEGGTIDQHGDHFMIELPSFNSYFDLTKSGEMLKGKWVVRNKNGYFVDVEAKPYSGYRVFEKPEAKVNFDGLWNVHLNDKNNTHIVGKFSQVRNHVEGTFLSNTGDYRFLEGQVNADSMILSSFVGSHSYMVKAKIVDDSIFGQFYSSKHYKVDFKGVKTDEIKMKDPYGMTYLTKKIDSLVVNLEDIKGKKTPVNFSQYHDEVVLIQIMGSWCANCYDEALFFKELHEKYHSKGLRILGLSYESSRSKEEAMKSLNKFISSNHIPYNIRYAGPAKKSTTSEQWNMFNKISSYPTSILLNKKGEVVQIHTGFNGPSTGDLYTNYTAKMTQTIESLLKE